MDDPSNIDPVKMKFFEDLAAQLESGGSLDGAAKLIEDTAVSFCSAYNQGCLELSELQERLEAGKLHLFQMRDGWRKQLKAISSILRLHRVPELVITPEPPYNYRFDLVVTNRNDEQRILWTKSIYDGDDGAWAYMVNALATRARLRANGDPEWTLADSFKDSWQEFIPLLVADLEMGAVITGSVAPRDQLSHFFCAGRLYKLP